MPQINHGLGGAGSTQGVALGKAVAASTPGPDKVMLVAIILRDLASSSAGESPPLGKCTGVPHQAIFF